MRMTKTANPRDLPESTRPVAALHQGDLRVMAAADRRSWASYAAISQRARPRNRKPPMEAAGAVDAKNAPTAPWKTAQNAVSHSYHRPHHRQPKCHPCSRFTLLPMLPVAQHRPGCSTEFVTLAAIDSAAPPRIELQAHELHDAVLPGPEARRTVCARAVYEQGPRDRRPSGQAL